MGARGGSPRTHLQVSLCGVKRRRKTRSRPIGTFSSTLIYTRTLTHIHIYIIYIYIHTRESAKLNKL